MNKQKELKPIQTVKLHIALIQGLSNGVNLETDLSQLRVIQDVSSVEQKRGLLHVRVDSLVVQVLEHVPLGHHQNRMRALRGLVRVLHHHHVLLQLRAGGLAHAARVLQLHVHRRLRRLRIVRHDVRLLLQQNLAHVRRGRLARVARVLLEGVAEHRQVLSRNGVEHVVDHAAREPLLLVVVHAHHPLPVLRHLRQPVRLRKVHQVQHVLLEAGTAVADGGGQGTFLRITTQIKNT